MKRSAHPEEVPVAGGGFDVGYPEAWQEVPPHCGLHRQHWLETGLNLAWFCDLKLFLLLAFR